MLAHKSGMIGLPLRLLAREVYDQIVRLKAPTKCALITGEEKIVPKAARYLCLHRRSHAAGDLASPAWSWTKSSSAPIRSAAMSSPTASACPRTGGNPVPWCGNHARNDPAFHSRAPGSSPGRAFPIWPIPAPKNSRDCPAVRPSWGFQRRGCLWHRRDRAAPARRRGRCAGRALARARAMPRWRSISQAKWISWLRQTPSAWV